MSKLNRIYLLNVILTCLTIFNCKSQNLIANASFEISTNNNCQGSFFDYAGGSSTFGARILADWDAYQSPDYFDANCPHSLIPGQYGYEVPANIFGYSVAHSGNAYVGISVYQGNNSEYKEYFYQQLLSPLQAGKIYCLSFYVSKSDRKEYAIKNIGAYFCNVLPSMVGNMYINAIPQVVHTNGVISDTTQWTQIQGCFTANGGEQYILLGNFNSNANTDTLYTGTNNPIPFDPQYSYYFFDDITLIDQATVGIKSIDRNSDFEIYPNPTTGLINFSNERYSNGDYNVKILDLFGKEILNKVLNEEIDISSFDKGVYTLLLYKNKQLVVTKKVMKN